MANYDPEYLSDAMYERMHRLGFGHYCRSGTEGIEFHPGFEPRSGEPVVVKHRFDGFYGTELDIVLRSRGVRTVVATGVAAHGCVYATAAHAYFNDYYVVMSEDLVGLGEPEELVGAMISIRDSYGITPTAAEISACWQPAQAPSAATGQSART
jgi:nicotinamidase-related amidase